MARLDPQFTAEGIASVLSYIQSARDGDHWINTGLQRLCILNTALDPAVIAAPVSAPTLAALDRPALLVDPVIAPTLSVLGTGGTVMHGRYQVTYTYFTAAQGETLSSPAAIISTPALSAPAAPVLLAGSSGGTWAATSAWVKVTYFTVNGETLAGPTISQPVNANGILIIQPPPSVTNAVGWLAYVAAASSAPLDSAFHCQQLSHVPYSMGSSLTLTDPPTTSGPALPTINTATFGDTNSLTIVAPSLPAFATGVNVFVAPFDGFSVPTLQATIAFAPSSSVLITSPTSTGRAAPTSNSTGMSSMSPGTYTVAYAWSDGECQTQIGPTATVTIARGQCINCTNIAALPVGAMDARIYASEAPNSSFPLVYTGFTLTTSYVVGTMPVGDCPWECNPVVVVHGQNTCNQGVIGAGHNATIVLGPGQVAMSGPFDAQRFSDVNGIVHVTYSTFGGVRVGVL